MKVIQTCIYICDSDKKKNESNDMNNKPHSYDEEREKKTIMIKADGESKYVPFSSSCQTL